MNDPVQFFWSLVQFQPMLIAVAGSLAVGYLLKLWPTYPNQRIPVASIGMATLVYLILCVPPVLADVGAVIRYLVETFVIGLVVGVLAWRFHAQILKRFETSIPFIGDKLRAAADSTPPETNQNK